MTYFKKIILSIFVVSSLIGCSTTDKNQEPEGLRVKPNIAPKSTNKNNRPANPTESDSSGIVDLEAIKQALDLRRPKETLGYTERLFENCGGKFGLPRSTTCQKLYFVLIHFKIQCRDSEGTVSEVITEDQLTPFANQIVKWSLKSLQGETKTDSNGLGQIQTLSAISQREQRLKLMGKHDFLYMAAGEIKRVVTPRPFCK